MGVRGHEVGSDDEAGAVLHAVARDALDLDVVADRQLDGAVSSAEAGAPKPDPAIFVSALALVRCEPAEALHVGDTREEDVVGARAAGIRALLLDRDGGEGDISSLSEIEEHL